MKQAGGYTLLEMLVVISLLALATALVTPAGVRFARSWADADAVTAVLRDIDRLPLVARRAGTPLEFAADVYAGEHAALPLPDGWQIEFKSPLRVRANGACSETHAWLRTGHADIPLRIDAPYCATSRLDTQP